MSTDSKDTRLDYFVRTGLEYLTNDYFVATETVCPICKEVEYYDDSNNALEAEGIAVDSSGQSSGTASGSNDGFPDGPSPMAVKITQCQGCHAFHYGCLIAWLESLGYQAGTCPIEGNVLYYRFEFSDSDEDYSLQPGEPGYVSPQPGDPDYIPPPALNPAPGRRYQGPVELAGLEYQAYLIRRGNRARIVMGGYDSDEEQNGVFSRGFRAARRQYFEEIEGFEPGTEHWTEWGLDDAHEMEYTESETTYSDVSTDRHDSGDDRGDEYSDESSEGEWFPGLPRRIGSDLEDSEDSNNENENNEGRQAETGNL